MWIQKMSRNFVALSIPVIASAFLFSCSGGGGGGEETPSVTSSSISGSVDTNGTSTASLPEGVTALVQVVSIDKKGKEIDSKVQTTTTGFFTLNVNTSQDGGKIVITASADGYTEGTKTIDYNAPEELNDLSVKLEVDPITQKIIPVSQINITSEGSKVIRVGFFKDKNGITKAVAGEYSIKKASENNKLIMELAIPVSKLSEGTENIKVSYKDFKPSNPNDYENFPGEETDKGDQLISVGFDWLEITDPQTGKNPFVSSQGQPSSQGISAQLAKVDLGEYYRLLRYVDCEQINKIKGLLGSLDEDTTKPGIQFTFYAFDWDVGAWVQAGQATFVDTNNSNLVKYYESGEDNDVVDTAWDYIIQNGCIDDTPCDPANPTSSACIDVDNDGNVEDVSCSGNHVITDENNICAEETNGEFSDTYVVISVTNPELNWKNLDYIKPGTGKVECKVTIKDNSGNPIPTNVQAYADNNGCIEWTAGTISAQTGETTLSTLKYCDPANGIIEYFDPINNMSVQYDGDDDGIPDTVTFCPPNDQNCTCEVNITIKNINKCTIEGYIKDESSNGKPNVLITINNGNYSIFRWGKTDNTGKYSIKVPCGIQLILHADSQISRFNVNGDIELDEVSDSNNVATLKDISVVNNPPDGYAWLSTYSTKKGNPVTAYLLAWDYENDLPIKYKLKVLDSSDQEVFSKTGTIANNYNQISETIDTTNLNAGTYKVEFILADSEYTGDISSASTKITEIIAGNLIVYEGNAAPVISYFYINPFVVSHVNSTVNIYGSAYDLDGDNLASSLSHDCYDENNNLVIGGDLPTQSTELLNNNITTYTIPSDNTIARCELTWTVSDGQDSTTVKRNVYVQNNPPIVSIWTNNQVVPSETESVTINSNIIEPDGDSYTCSWLVNGVPTGETDCDSFELDLESYTPPTEIEVELIVTDVYGNSGSSVLTIFYGKQTDLNISIQ